MAKLQIDFNKALLNRHPNDHKEKPIHLSKRHNRILGEKNRKTYTEATQSD